MNKDIYIELKELKSSLGENDDRFIYKAPEGYFDIMQEEVLNDLKHSNTKVKVLSRFRLGIGIAASIAILVAFVLLFNKPVSVSDEITSDDAFEYLMENIEYLDNKSLTYMIFNSDFEIEDDIITSEYDIDEYLEENIDDITEEDLELIF